MVYTHDKSFTIVKNRQCGMQWRARLEARVSAEGRHFGNKHMNRKLAIIINIHC